MLIGATIALLTAGQIAMPCAFAQTPLLDLATIRPLFEDFFESRRLQSEPYGRYKMYAGDSGPSHYASLDVALARTIMGVDLETSLSEQQRTQWIGHLHTYARPDGTYSDPFHEQLHANGMTIGALGALGGKQLYPASPLYAPFNEPAEAVSFLGSLDRTNLYAESHHFWGGLAMYSQSARATPEWTNAVFGWLDSNVNPSTGWWVTGVPAGSNLNVEGVGSGAHMWPIYEHLGHAFPQPERVIDSILSMQVANGRFGGDFSASGYGYVDLDALYGLRYMRSLAPGYRSADIVSAAEKFGQWLVNDINGFMAAGPNMHNVLSKVGGFGLLNQLAPSLFPDSTGAQWTDIFTDPKFYQTAAVETFTFGGTPVGNDDPSPYSAAVLAGGPRGYWRLGQTGGVAAAEASTNNLQGLYNSLGAGSGPGNLGQAGPRSVDGYPGLGDNNRAVHLNGSNSYALVPDTAELDITGAMTMEAWIKLDAIPAGNGGIVGKYVGPGDQRSYLLYVNGQDGDGGLGMVISPDGTFTSATDLLHDVSLTLGQWMHVAGTFEPNQFMRLYINGELVEELTSGIPSHIFNSSSDLWIGLQYDASPAHHLPGLIDEVAIYARALSAAEIADHYAAALTNPPVDVPGDFDSDGDVDGADFVVWQTNFPTAGGATLADGDADNDGDVDGADFVVWQTNFPTTPALAASPVPEPDSVGIALICAIAAAMQHRRRR